ncbi:MAG: radical SAM protein [Pseudomonadota bacterium]
MGLLYSKMKIFHYKEKIDSLPADNPQILPPIHIRIKPTNMCNHNCRYCAYRADNLQLGKDMDRRSTIPKDKMMEIIDDIVDMGVKAVTFSGGGEPFCYPHLLDVAMRLSETPVKFASLSNGSRVTGEVAEVFARNATWLRVSMDGWDDASYSEYRGVGHGEFTKVLNNIAAFAKIGGSCYLGVSLIIDQRNSGHVYELVAKLRDNGVNSVKISPCIVSNNGRENNDYHKPFFGTVRDQVDLALRDFAAPDFEIFDSYHLLEEKFEKDYTWCPYLQILCVIGADLNIYSCQDKAYNLDCGLLGSIKNQSFKHLWFAEKSKFFVINPGRDCEHHCVANAKNRLIFEYLDADSEHADFV